MKGTFIATDKYLQKVANFQHHTLTCMRMLMDNCCSISNIRQNIVIENVYEI